jgi:AcrR family transcriptional regulator
MIEASAAAPADTKTRILDTAERLFSERGIAATSLRSIISEAQVNLAAVHYHFRNKEALVEALILRRAGIVNQQRLALLEAFEAAAAPAAPSIEQILEAFIAPTIQAVSGRLHFPRFLARVLTEPAPVLTQTVGDIFRPLFYRFGEALHRARPDLPREEVFWRLVLSVSSMMFVLTAGEKVRAISNGLCDTADPGALTRRLIAFGAAGFSAPNGEPPKEHSAT